MVKPTFDEPFTKNNTGGKLDDFLEIIEKKCSREKMLDKWAPMTDDDDESGRHRLFDLSNEKLGSVTYLEKEALCEALGDYWKMTTLRDTPKILDVARRLYAGTGSLGMDRYYVLIREEDNNNSDGTIRILDVQGAVQAMSSALYGRKGSDYI